MVDLGDTLVYLLSCAAKDRLLVAVMSLSEAASPVRAAPLRRGPGEALEELRAARFGVSAAADRAGMSDGLDGAVAGSCWQDTSSHVFPSTREELRGVRVGLELDTSDGPSAVVVGCCCR